MDARQFDEVLQQYHHALGEFMRGSADAAKKLFSQRDDVSLGNPFGPFASGWEAVVETMERAAANYSDGEAIGFDTVAKHVTPELAYTVEVERLRSKVGGRDQISSVTLRVTTVFRPEAEGWRIVHRHADPIGSPRPAESVLSD